MIDFSARHASEVPLESLKAFFRSLEGSSVTEYHVLDSSFIWHTDIPHPWFNGVLFLRKP